MNRGNSWVFQVLSHYFSPSGNLRRPSCPARRSWSEASLGPCESGGDQRLFDSSFLREGIPISGKILKVYKRHINTCFFDNLMWLLCCFFAIGTRNGRHTLLMISACVCRSGYSCMTNRNCRQLMEVKAAINIINSIYTCTPSWNYWISYSELPWT